MNPSAVTSSALETPVATSPTETIPSRAPFSATTGRRRILAFRMIIRAARISSLDLQVKGLISITSTYEILIGMQVVGPVIGGFLAENKGWRWTFWLLAILVS